jgi:hypothetical protein
MVSSAFDLSVAPADFYARRSEELRAAAEERAARYGKYTQILVAVGLLLCMAFYLSVFAKRWPIWTPFVFLAPGVWVVRERLECAKHRSHVGNRRGSSTTLRSAGKRVTGGSGADVMEQCDSYHAGE